MRSLIIRRASALFLPTAVAFTIAVGISYLAVQQDLRIGANDLPQQLAEDGVRALDGGADPATVVGRTAVPIEASLAPFVGIFDAQGKLLASNGALDGEPPSPPIGVLQSAQATGRDVVSWQPAVRRARRARRVAVAWGDGRRGSSRCG